MTDSETEPTNAELAEFLKGFCRNVPQDPCDTERIALICSRLEQSVPKEVADALLAASTQLAGALMGVEEIVKNVPQIWPSQITSLAMADLLSARTGYNAATKETP